MWGGFIAARWKWEDFKIRGLCWCVIKIFSKRACPVDPPVGRWRNAESASDFGTSDRDSTRRRPGILAGGGLSFGAFGRRLAYCEFLLASFD